ncbi:MAG: restriction endonuclease subunit S [Vicingaceae bacterium]
MSKTDKQNLKPGYKQSAVGMIPEDWEVLRLEKVCSHFKSGKNITSKQIQGAGDYPVYGGNGLRGYFDSYTHEGCFVLIGRQGALCGNIQMISGRTYISEHAIAVQTNNKNDLKYLRYKLEFKNLNRLSESSAQPGLSVSKLLRYKIPLPPLPEQEKIAAILSCWDSAIEKCEAAIKGLEKRNKGLAQQLLRGPGKRPTPNPSEEGNLREQPSEEGNSGKKQITQENKNRTTQAAKSTKPSPLSGGNHHPKSPLPGGDLGVGPAEGKHLRLKGFEGDWEEVKLGDFFTERKEAGFDNLPLLSVGEKGVYPQNESNKKDTSNKNKSKYKRICPNDIGYNTMRMWQGRSALSDLEGIVSPAYTIVTPKKNANPKFFAALIKIDEVVHKFYRNSQGLVSDTLNCKFKDFKIVKVNVPPTLEEQHAIVDILDQADQELALQIAKKEALQKQKAGLMQKLLTGEVRVK